MSRSPGRYLAPTCASASTRSSQRRTGCSTTLVPSAGEKKYGLHAYAVRNAAVARWLLFDVVKTSCPSGEWFGNTENPSAEMNKLLRESTVAGDGQLRTWCYNNPRCDYHKADLPPVILDGCGLRATDRHSQGLLLQWGIGEALRFPGPLQLPANCTAVPGSEDLPRFHEAR